MEDESHCPTALEQFNESERNKQQEMEISRDKGPTPIYDNDDENDDTSSSAHRLKAVDRRDVEEIGSDHDKDNDDPIMNNNNSNLLITTSPSQVCMGPTTTAISSSLSDHNINSSNSSTTGSNTMLIPRFIDSSYLKAIPEDRSDDGASSIIGDFSGIVLSSGRKAMSTTSSTGAMMLPDDEDDDDLYSDNGGGGKPSVVTKNKTNTTTILSTNNSSSKQRTQKSLLATTFSGSNSTHSSTVAGAVIGYDPNSLSAEQLGDDVEEPINSSHSRKQKKSSSTGIPVPAHRDNNFGKSYQRHKRELRKKFWSQFWTKRIIISVSAGMILLIGVVAAIITVVMLNDSKSNTKSESPNGTTKPPLGVDNEEEGDDDGNVIIGTESPSIEIAATLLDAYIKVFATDIVNTNYTEEYLYSVFNDTTSPQYKARNWLLTIDELLVDTIQQGFDRFQQRYGLIVLYYQMNGPYWILSSASNDKDTNQEGNGIDFLQPTLHECNWTGIYCADIEIDDADGDNVIDDDPTMTMTPYRNPESDLIKDADDDNNDVDDGEFRRDRHSFFRHRRRQQQLQPQGEHQQTMTRKRRWLQTDKVEVVADNGTTMSTTIEDRVVRVQMKKSNLSGTIPFEIAAIQSLKELDLSDNQIAGTIPVEIFDVLDNIQLLDLSNNVITGSIPSILWSLGNLHQLYLNDNNFTGGITSRFTRSTSLQHVWIQRNRLTGSLPSWLSDLYKLKVFIAFENQLNGTIPRPVPKNIEYFDLSRNQIAGSIPDSLWSQADWTAYLTRVYLDNNKLTGTLPDSDEALLTLKYVWLHNNSLTGEIPTGFGQMWKNIKEIRLGDNNLAGILGPQYYVMDTGSNGTTGSGGGGPIRTNVCQDVWSNMTVLIADCFEYYANQPPPVLCDCCTYCETTTNRRY